MADCTSIATLLAAARAAYHDLMTGSGISRFIDQNGESVSYTRANEGKLSAYIAKLENDLAICQGAVDRAYRGPIRFTYGRR